MHTEIHWLLETDPLSEGNCIGQGRLAWGERDRTGEGYFEAGKGRSGGGSGPGGGNSTGQILNPILSLINFIWPTQICISKFTGGDLVSPMEVAGARYRERGKISPYFELRSSQCWTQGGHQCRPVCLPVSVLVRTGLPMMSQNSVSRETISYLYDSQTILLWNGEGPTFIPFARAKTLKISTSSNSSIFNLFHLQAYKTLTLSKHTTCF